MAAMSFQQLFFFFKDTATTEIYTLSLHDALPICSVRSLPTMSTDAVVPSAPGSGTKDRKSTRLNSSHANISYAVFCLKKNKPPAALGGRRMTNIAWYLRHDKSRVLDTSAPPPRLFWRIGLALFVFCVNVSAIAVSYSLSLHVALPI